MEKTGAQFRTGTVVYLRVDPSRCGPIIDIIQNPGGTFRYRVFHSASLVREYDEEQLVELKTKPASEALMQALFDNVWVDSSIFKARMTAERLGHPLIDNLYSLQAARIQYVPFQFKPLVRFLRADQPRLLIADEVGVGKTIEAGLILRELQTRQLVENILIVCPKALVFKWQVEMLRFDEDFRVLTPESLRACIREANRDGVWPRQYGRSIVNLELLRANEYIYGDEKSRKKPGLVSLDPPPRFDLIIIDEAHHARNFETNSFKVAQYLCEISESVLLLSATPVHLGSENLFALLHLLRPDLFIDMNTFNEMVEPNRYITDAMRHVRTCSPMESWKKEAALSMRKAAESSWGRRVMADDPDFNNCIRVLEADGMMTDHERITCLRDMEETHTLSHIMNRTRRRDIGRFTIREPKTIQVDFTEEQRAFYDGLLNLRKDVLLLDYDPRVVSLITDTLQRQAASCLPSVAQTLEGMITRRRISIEDVSDDVEETEQFQEAELPQELIERAEELKRIADALPDDDPKLDQLISIVEKAIEDEGPGKVLIFAFFLNTIAYLARHLAQQGIRVGVVTGIVPEEERQEIRDYFRLERHDKKAIDVLISSEVGCEGLDYEFCNTLVNYDIPWNPMRIEQRIGRIDRFGQNSEKVFIFNFVTPGTIEERIFYRCYDRLGIFRDTVGDLEEVLGSVVKDLTRLALSPSLTAEQAEEKAKQTTDNAIRLFEEQKRLESESGSLLGLDQLFEDEVKALKNEGRYITSNDLQHMVNIFLQVPELGLNGEMASVAGEPDLLRFNLKREAKATLLGMVDKLQPIDRAIIEFKKWLEHKEQYLYLTFSQQYALDHRNIQYITPVHPLARVSASFWRDSDAPLVAGITVTDQHAPSGIYLFTCELWETIAIKPELRMIGIAWNVNSQQISEEISTSLMRLIDKGEKSRLQNSIPANLLELGYRQCEREAQKARLTAYEALKERNAALIKRKIASLSKYYETRIIRVNQELEASSNERIIRMKEAELARIKRDYENNLKKIEAKRDSDIVSQRLAVGILEVRDAV